MSNITIISDKKWIDTMKLVMEDFSFNTVDFNVDDFAINTNNLIKEVNTEYIALVNPSCEIDPDNFKNFFSNINPNKVIIYSGDLKEVDFSQITNDSCIMFPKSLYTNISIKFPNVVQLEKHILTNFIDNPKIDIIGFNRHSKLSIYVDQWRLKKNKIEKWKNNEMRLKKLKNDIQNLKYDEKEIQKLKPKRPNSKNELEILEKIVINSERKPKILLISDVKGWAWWNKSLYLKKYLSDDFDIDMVYIHEKGSVKKIDEKKYDLYLTYGYSYVYLLNRVPKKKRITGVTAHRSLDKLKHPMSKAYATHANSILLLNQLKTIHNNVYYVPNGVDEELFTVKTEIPLERPDNRLVVGHVGKLTPLKCQKEIIEPAVKNADCDYIHHYNTYENKIPHSQMVDLYQKMDVFIVASIEDGTPNPALEAMACGRPVIANRIGNMPEVIIDGYNGFLVERDINSYVEKLNYLKNNRELLIEMGKNARKTIEEGWTIKHMTDRYRQMFWDIINN